MDRTELEEKILDKLVTQCQTHEHRGCACSPKEAEGCWGSLASELALIDKEGIKKQEWLKGYETGKIFATLNLPDLIKEAEAQEREGIIGIIKNINSIDYAYGAEFKAAILQALGEE